MTMTTTLPLALLACTSLAAQDRPAEALAWRHDVRQAVTDARGQGKLLLVFITGPET